MPSNLSQNRSTFFGLACRQLEKAGKGASTRIEYGKVGRDDGRVFIRVRIQSDFLCITRNYHVEHTRTPNDNLSFFHYSTFA